MPIELFIKLINNLTNHNITLLIPIPPHPLGLTMLSTTGPIVVIIVLRVENIPVPPNIIFLIICQNNVNDNGTFNIYFININGANININGDNTPYIGLNIIMK